MQINFHYVQTFKNIIFSFNASHTKSFRRKAVSNELLPLNIYIDLIDCIAEVIIYIFRHLNHLIAHCFARFRLLLLFSI